ncbi:site-specific recombinase XerD [Sporocytophaga myxococcoides]|uniref:Site-specific recombinase XerD n=1 Tax=Sporocytophaga myxococcoides TaxID=153721 RepID=A0A098LDV8_9BACT|nr:site-specific integrase [Sporocytophaga myxococcoides]GAL84243.1 site-specific recombinase XerD [Sporocytophaga myxococcoides]
MATIKIIIRKENGKIRINSKGESAIFIQYGHLGKSILFPTSIKVDPHFLKFNNKDLDQREPIRKSLPGYSVKNSNIRKLAQEIDHIKDRLINQDIVPTVEEVRRIYNQKHKPEEIKDFFTVYEEFINENRAVKAGNTIKQYITSFNHLKDFQKFSKDKIRFEKIDLRFYDKYLNYLITEKNLANNTVGTQIKDLKAFLNYIKKRGISVSTDVNEFKVLREKPTIIYLSQKELSHLYNFDFKGNQKLERARDLFCLQAATGLRISDLFRLGKEHIQENTIRLKAHKTKTDVLVPLTPISSGILSKYNYDLPLISEQKQNENIKLACYEAGLKRKLEIAEYKGGRKEYRTAFLFELITSHVAIKSFISHAIEKGLSPAVVAKITGKTTKILLQNYYSTHDTVVKTEMEKAFGSV